MSRLIFPNKFLDKETELFLALYFYKQHFNLVESQIEKILENFDKDFCKILASRYLEFWDIYGEYYSIEKPKESFHVERGLQTYKNQDQLLHSYYDRQIENMGVEQNNNFVFDRFNNSFFTQGEEFKVEQVFFFISVPKIYEIVVAYLSTNPFDYQYEDAKYFVNKYFKMQDIYRLAYINPVFQHIYTERMKYNFLNFLTCGYYVSYIERSFPSFSYTDETRVVPNLENCVVFNFKQNNHIESTVCASSKTESNPYKTCSTDVNQLAFGNIYCHVIRTRTQILFSKEIVEEFEKVVEQKYDENGNNILFLLIKYLKDLKVERLCLEFIPNIICELQKFDKHVIDFSHTNNEGLNIYDYYKLHRKDRKISVNCLFGDYHLDKWLKENVSL